LRAGAVTAAESPRNLRAGAVAAAAVLTIGGCGGGGGGDRPKGSAVHTVEIVRAAFPARQRLGQESSLVLTVRNAGDTTIGDLVVTLRGLSQRSVDERRPLWLLDASPPGAVTAIDDTWAAGALAPGASATLRWRVTAVRPGTHELDYTIAAGLGKGARARLAGGRAPRGRLTVRVLSRPAIARVDPRSGRVARE
jgi:hypothetical protein